MKKNKITGGARIGSINVTWPFAELSFEKEELLLTTVFSQRRMKPSQVAKLEPCRGLITRGIRIIRSDSFEKIIFWYFGDPKIVIEKVYETGFMPSGEDPSESNIKVNVKPLIYGVLLGALAILILLLITFVVVKNA